MHKIIMGCFITLIISNLGAGAQPKEIKNIEADSAWQQLERIGKDAWGGKGGFASNQAVYLKYRENGLKFWKQFPNDIRKYKWLDQTVRFGHFLHYLDIKSADTSYRGILRTDGPVILMRNYKWPINKKSLQNWELVYPQLKKDYLAHYVKNATVNNGRRFNDLDFLVYEFQSFLTLSRNREYWIKDKIDLNKVRSLFLAMGRYLNKISTDIQKKERSAVYNVLSQLFDSYNEFGLSLTDVTSFINSFASSQYGVLRNWAIQRNSLYALMQHPFSFKHPSIEGDTIDLEEMRGKVVLIDFWTLMCVNCIARMPAIKTVYDKYKSQGFEVISVCVQNEDRLYYVKELEQKIGADWPTVMIGSSGTANSLGQQIWKKYGFVGVPQLLLFNKQGKLVMLNNKLSNGDFEPIVKQLLTEKYDPSK